MQLLLDTHVLLWALTDDTRLGPGTREALGDPRNLVHVSAASFWEVAIKSAAGRLDVGDLDLLAHVREAGLLELAINPAHAWAAGGLPPHHRDPFDRVLVAQAQLEGLVLATVDDALSSYEVQRWDAHV